jgi:hypothetical protein
MDYQIPVLVSQTIYVVSGTQNFDLQGIASLMEAHQVALSNQIALLEISQNKFELFMTIFVTVATGLIALLAGGLTLYLNQRSEKAIRKDSYKKINRYIAADELNDNEGFFENLGQFLAKSPKKEAQPLRKLDTLPISSIQLKKQKKEK